MKPIDIILLNLLNEKAAIEGKTKPSRPGIGNFVSSTTVSQMQAMNSFFPDAHYDAKKMFDLSKADYEILGYDMIMPVFSVVVESYAMGCAVDWGKPSMMPQIKSTIWKNYSDIGYRDKDIKNILLKNNAVKALLECLSMLKKKYPHIAVCGKVFGPWTLSYHFFGVQEFLIKTIDNPLEVKSILDKLCLITICFAELQAQAGADIITVADHATADLCSPQSYRDFLIPVHSLLARQIKVPAVLHICGNTLDRLDYICRTGMAGFHFESKVDACAAQAVNKRRIALAGNINNPSTLLFKKPRDVRKEALYAAKCGVKIIGPECAVPLSTPAENLLEISKTIKSLNNNTSAD
ncbi:MAG: MtaA/CmuA family methyltransferase [Actinobacteria bacterium]|nr:MtaA/CmuA family methyltransferase [Actinomycetota bacterium]